MSSAKDQLHLRQPTATDGANLFELVAQCPPLDGNSMYCNLLQCSHFADTSVAAETDGELVGFISAYRVPERRDTLFVWQVAVGASARGRGSYPAAVVARPDQRCRASRIRPRVRERGSPGLPLPTAFRCHAAPYVRTPRDAPPGREP